MNEKKDIKIDHAELNRQKEIMQRLKENNMMEYQNNGKQKRYFVITFGCQQNVSDSEKLMGMLDEMGYLKTEKKEDQFIVSKTGILDNENGSLSFKLIDGKAFIINEKEFNQIDFRSMYINDSIADSKLGIFTDSYSFWKNNIKNNIDTDDLTFYVLTALFPLISLFLVITFGYFNPRYEKNRAVFYSLISVVLYYVLVKVIGDEILLHALYIIPIIWIFGTYILYARTIQKEY